MWGRTQLYWLVPIVIVLAVAGMSCATRRAQRMGLVNGRLAPCPGSPNCVSSEEKAGLFRVEPLAFTGTPEEAWARLKRTVQEMGGKIRKESDGYLWATFRSKVFQFVDDMEFRMDAANKVIHVRSASRLGYSDLGVNRKRVETLRARFSR